MTYRPYPNAERAFRQVKRHPRPAPSMRIAPVLIIPSDMALIHKQLTAATAEAWVQLRKAAMLRS